MQSRKLIVSSIIFVNLLSLALVFGMLYMGSIKEADAHQVVCADYQLVNCTNSNLSSCNCTGTFLPLTIRRSYESGGPYVGICYDPA